MHLMLTLRDSEASASPNATRDLRRQAMEIRAALDALDGSGFAGGLAVGVLVAQARNIAKPERTRIAKNASASWPDGRFRMKAPIETTTGALRRRRQTGRVGPGGDVARRSPRAGRRRRDGQEEAIRVGRRATGSRLLVQDDHDHDDPGDDQEPPQGGFISAKKRLIPRSVRPVARHLQEGSSRRKGQAPARFRGARPGLMAAAARAFRTRSGARRAAAIAATSSKRSQTLRRVGLDEGDECPSGRPGRAPEVRESPPDRRQDGTHENGEADILVRVEHGRAMYRRLRGRGGRRSTDSSSCRTAASRAPLRPPGPPGRPLLYPRDDPPGCTTQPAASATLRRLRRARCRRPRGEHRQRVSHMSQRSTGSHHLLSDPDTRWPSLRRLERRKTSRARSTGGWSVDLVIDGEGKVERQCSG